MRAMSASTARKQHDPARKPKKATRDEQEKAMRKAVDFSRGGGATHFEEAVTLLQRARRDR